MRRANLQVKFGLSYILVIAAVLVFMNTYPLIVSENLVVRSKQTTLQSSVSVMVTALSGLEELSEENVASAMTLVEDTGISRILVTDAAGRILYDTRETDGAVGRYGLYTEIVQALRGYDAFYADFTDGAFRSRAASPVIYHSQTIGAVYAYEYDVEQATLLLTLQKNLLRISAAVAGFVVLLSLLLSRMLTRRFGVLLEAIRRVRDYLAERGRLLPIECEVRSLEDIDKVFAAGGVDRIMFDNFTPEMTRRAVEKVAGRCETESSGGITLDTIREYAECGVDFISVGALTHQIRSLDMSLKACE